jgi:hypothetical protein
MKNFLFIFAFTSFLRLSAQNKFESGYFINNDGSRVECLIKNIDWIKNPNEFLYKTNDSEIISTGSINTVKEFQIYNKVYYKRFKVSIDKSKQLIDDLSDSFEPDFKEEVLFLKVLVEGKATLYLFHDSNYRRFFFEKDYSGIAEQLIYKFYSISDIYTIGENKTFQKQLQSNFKIESLPDYYYKNIKHFESDLTKFFKKYNGAGISDKQNFQTKEKKVKFNLNLRLGLVNSSLNYLSKRLNLDTNFETKTNFRYGLESEFIMPFNNNKWSVIFEPTYFKYEAQQSSTAKGYNEFQKIKYRFIEVPFGVRYYLFLNKSSKFFINTSVVADINLSSKFEIETTNSVGTNFQRLEVIDYLRSVASFTYGVGYKFKDKYSLEFKSGITRKLNNFDQYNSTYQNYSIIFGYKLF